MSEEVDALRAEVAALRAEVARARDGESKAITRRRLLTGLAGLGAAGAVGVATASPAGADDDDPILLGQENTATTPTVVSIPDGDDAGSIQFPYSGLAAFAAAAEGSNSGLFGSAGEGGLAGVEGWAGSPGAGVAGFNTEPGGIAVAGLTQAGGPALAGQNDVDGVTLFLVPAERSGPPNDMPSGITGYDKGSFSVDDEGEVWLCTANGAPGSWTRLLREDTAIGRVIPIAPVRALDTRATGGRPSGSPAVPGQKKGPLKGGETITLDPAGVSPIPATATGVIGNLIVLSPNYTGYLRAAPSGAPLTATAVSFTNGDFAGNAYTVGLGPDGVAFRASGTTTNHYELVVDITAYIT